MGVLVKAAGALLILSVIITAIRSPTEPVTGNDAATPAEAENMSSSIWRDSDTPLSEFAYYTENGEIHLEEYKGKSKAVRIAPSYEVDGKRMPVVALESTFTLRSIDSVIVPEGVVYIANNTFNSCRIRYVYLPSTLKDFSGCSYFHNMLKLYYGGTQEQWPASVSTPSDRIDTQAIIFQADPQKLE